MSQLVIEYTLEGHRRGYDFISAAYNYDDLVLKAIWRNAMPRGQGWGDPLYIGSRSIKCFLLPDDRIAVSETTVTDLADENGRRGIRRAVIDVMSKKVFSHHIRSRLEGYPQHVQLEAKRLHEHVKYRMPRLKKDMPLILTRTFTTPVDWWPVEALVMRLSVEPPTPLNRRPALWYFTTLALNYRSESPLLALPLTKVEDLDQPYLQV